MPSPLPDVHFGEVGPPTKELPPLDDDADDDEDIETPDDVRELLGVDPAELFDDESRHSVSDAVKKAWLRRPLNEDEWKEREHPRGQPKNAGQFAEGGGGGGKPKSTGKKAAAPKRTYNELLAAWRSGELSQKEVAKEMKKIPWEEVLAAQQQRQVTQPTAAEPQLKAAKSPAANRGTQSIPHETLTYLQDKYGFQTIERGPDDTSAILSNTPGDEIVLTGVQGAEPEWNLITEKGELTGTGIASLAKQLRPTRVRTTKTVTPVYHATKREFIDSIKRRGLKINAPTRNFSDGYYEGERGQSVYVSSNLKSAVEWADVISKETEGTEVVILEIHIPPGQQLKPDVTAGGSALQYRADIPPDWIKSMRSVTNEGKTGEPEAVQDQADSVRYMTLGILPNDTDDELTPEQASARTKKAWLSRKRAAPKEPAEKRTAEPDPETASLLAR